MRSYVFYLILLSLMCAGSLDAQKVSRRLTITGIVTDASGSPISNAIVMIDGKKSSSVTDSYGKYKIRVPGNARMIGILTFSRGIREEEINGREKIDISFGVNVVNQIPDQGIKSGDESVNVGYNYIKKRNATNEAVNIDGTDKKYRSYSSIYEMIRRKDASVRISGEDIIIQDSKNLFGPVPALLVVDGVYVSSISNIQPPMVESITILKGTSAAIYGSRGYGGAIVIKTKLKEN